MSRIIPMLLILGLAMPAAAIDRKSAARAQSQAEKGEKQLDKENFDSAEKAFRKAISIEPALPGSHAGLAAALIGQRKYADGLEVVQEAKKRYEEWQQIQLDMLSESRMQAKTRAQDMRHYEQPAEPKTGTSSAPRTGSILAQAERSQIKTEEHLAEQQWATREQQESPIPAHVHYLEGIALLRTSRPAEGVAALERCIEGDPAHGLAHYNLAVAYFGQGKLDDAAEHLEAAQEAGVEPHPKFVEDLKAAQKR